MTENIAPESEGSAAENSNDVHVENSADERVPFTVEMMELDNNPIILQPKSY